MQLYADKSIAEDEQKMMEMLSKGIDDMEMGRELPIEAAFERVNQLRENNRLARV